MNEIASRDGVGAENNSCGDSNGKGSRIQGEQEVTIKMGRLS